MLAANSATLATVALRPHLIWGPGDPHLVPRVLDRGRRKRLRMADLRNQILAAGHLPPVTKTIAPELALVVGGMMEVLYQGLRIKTEPMLTRFVARQLSTDHWFDIKAARRDLGYEPGVSICDGLER